MKLETQILQPVVAYSPIRVPACHFNASWCPEATTDEIDCTLQPATLA